MLDGQRVLKSETIAELQAPVVQVGPELHYALGWFVRQPAGAPRLVFHGGDEAHYHADIFIIPEMQMGVAVSMNANSLATYQLHTLSRNILNLAQDRPPETVGYDPILLALTYLPALILVLQVAWALRELRQIQRLKKLGDVQERRNRRALWAMLSITMNLGVALGFLILIPWLFELPFSALFKFAPDFAWPAAISSGFALCWLLVRIRSILREFTAPATAH